MKEDRNNIEFEDFLKEVELHKAPDSFTDNVMTLVAAKQQAKSYMKFWLVYGISIFTIVVSYFFLSKDTVESASITPNYFDKLLAYFSQMSLPQVNFSIPITVSLVFASIFLLLLIDNKYRSSLKLSIN